MGILQAGWQLACCRCAAHLKSTDEIGAHNGTASQASTTQIRRMGIYMFAGVELSRVIKVEAY